MTLAISNISTVDYDTNGGVLTLHHGRDDEPHDVAYSCSPYMMSRNDEDARRKVVEQTRHLLFDCNSADISGMETEKNR